MLNIAQNVYIFILAVLDKKISREIYSVNQFQNVAFVLLLSIQPVLSAPPEKSSPVTVVEVVTQSLREEIPLTATAEAVRESSISSRIEGVVEGVFVDEGDWVEAGQNILVLDRAIAKIEVESAQARVEEAIARHKHAKRQKNEYQSLIDRQHVSASTLASALSDEEAAKASVTRQRAELMRFKELLSRHTLSAPFSGILAKKFVETGQWVKADSGVVKLVAMDTIRIKIDDTHKLKSILFKWNQYIAAIYKI